MSKIKNLVSAAAVVIMCGAALPAFAQDMPMRNGPMMGGHKAWMHKNMQRIMADAPVPMLMPVVLHHAVQLKLTPTQDEAIQKMLRTQHKNFPVWRRTMVQNNKALREAILNGETGQALLPLKKAVIQDQRSMLNHGIQQTEYLHKLLTPVQWAEAVKMADHPWGRQKEWHK